MAGREIYLQNGILKIELLRRKETVRKGGQRLRMQFEMIETIRRQNQMLSLLHDTARGLMHRKKLDELLYDIVAKACRLFSTEHGYIYLVDEKAMFMELKVGSGIYSELVGVRREPGQGISGTTWQKGEAVIVTDYKNWPQRNNAQIFQQVESAMAFPLKAGKRIIGVLGLDYYGKSRRFSEADQLAMDRLAELASLALDNAQLYEQTQKEIADRQRQNQYLSHLHQTALALMEGLELPQLLDRIIRQIAEQAGTPNGFIYLVDAKNRRIELKVGLGHYQSLVGVRRNKGFGMAGRVWQSGEILIIADYRSWPQRNPDVVFDEVRAAIALPLKAAGQVIGVVGIDYSKEEHVFEQEEIDWLRHMAQLLALAIEKTMLYEAVQRELAERKQVEAALALSEEKFSKAFHHSSDAIGLIRWRDKKFSEVNEAFFRIFGYEREEVIGHTTGEIGLWKNESDMVNSRRELQEKRARKNMELGWKTKSGECTWGICSDEIIEISGEEYILFVWHDITERRRVQEELLRLNEELEDKVLQRTQDLLAANRELTLLNREAARANEELVRLNQELNLTQESLVRSEKMAVLAGLVAGVAHEINTPVGICVTLASHLDLLTKNLETSYGNDSLKRSELEEYLAECREVSHMLMLNTQRAAQLVANFKQVSTDQAGEVRRIFVLHEYIEEILTSLSARLKKSGHRISVECAPEITMDAYPGALAQILTNLILNSFNHAYEPGVCGHIRIKVSLKGASAVIKYKDDGKGIARDALKKIFDPFFTTNRQCGGTGLGLYIVYNLVTQLYGGTIQCKSRPGEGVEFIIELPLRVGEREA